MKFEKAVVFCPDCKKPVKAYILNFRDLENRKVEIMTVAEVGTSNFCPYCGCDLRPMQRECEECGFIDWADVFTGECPYCELDKEVEKCKETKK